MASTFLPHESCTAEQCARLLERGKSCGGYWVACCPAHDDHNPSLLLRDAPDGGLILRCFAGCTYHDIAEALRAKGAMLPRRHLRERPFDEHPQLGKPHFFWEYHDELGRVIMRVCRWNQPNGRKDIRPLCKTADGWKWAFLEGKRPLWQLDRLALNPDKTVLLVEGEKAAVAAQKLFPEMVATTWPGGANAAGLADWEPLRGRDVILVPDCDDAGRKAMQWAAQALAKVRAQFRTLDPSKHDPKLPDGWDLADALDSGRNVSEWFSELEPKPIGIKINWRTLSSTDPVRQWAIEHWLPMGHVTLLAASGGTGKSLLAQTMGSCLALGRDYLDKISSPKRVIYWAGEDEPDELHRRQNAVCRWLEKDLADFADNFHAISYFRDEITLARMVDRYFEPTAMLTLLREQIGDLKADVVLLDNVARLYGGNENDRHQVSTFIAWLNMAAEPTGAAIVLLSHTAKAKGSEYSGSTAWENAVRTRLYMGRKPPGGADEDNEDDPTAPDDGSRFLFRRKSNYSAIDWRRLRMSDGVMFAEGFEQAKQRSSAATMESKDIVLNAIRHLKTLNEFGTSSTSSSLYLPRLAEKFGLLGSLTRKDFGRAMIAAQLDGLIVKAKVGLYPNRTERFGFVIAQVPDAQVTQ